MNDGLLTATEFASATGLSASTVYLMMKTGEITPVKKMSGLRTLNLVPEDLVVKYKRQKRGYK